MSKKQEVIDLFARKGLPPLEKLRTLLTGPLTDGRDFSELYLENTVAKGYRLSEGIISDITSTRTSGGGIRVVRGNNTGYSYTEDLDLENIRRCLTDASRIAGSGDRLQVTGYSGRKGLYEITSSLDEATALKIELLRRAEKKAFALSPYVEKVEVNFSEAQKTVLIVDSLGVEAADVRPMLTFAVSVVLNKDGKREGGFQAGGGRVNLSFFTGTSPEKIAEEAVNQALILLDARPAPAGEMEVVLGAGESGILLHESIGHPLEADFNYRGSSAFSGKIGQKVASTQCTIIDQGDLPQERGSLNVDDEGCETGKTVLIEEGILKTYMFDLITARHFGTRSHNGRRESFRHVPLPRMTNTIMLGGEYDREEILASIKKGVYAKGYSGGQVDISAGDFVFSVTEGYLIENGKISHPIKGATLIGNGPEILKRVTMVGSDLVVSDGKWTCGKEGQHVPVGVGMPTVKLSHITVGGTDND